MLDPIINQNMNVRQWKIILWLNFVEISIVDTNSDLPIFFDDRNNVSQPGRVLSHFYQPRLNLFGNLVFNFQTQLGLELPNLLLYFIKPLIIRQFMRYNISTQPLRVTYFPEKHINIFSMKMN